MSHAFQCRCGTLRGEIVETRRGLRATCYCGDCQAYAHLLGNPATVLDPLGGTDVVATPASNVRLTAGAEALACVSLSPRGLLRWYARCCNTPVANTPRDWKLPYTGMVHSCLRQPVPLEQSYPEVQLRVNTHGAVSKPPAARGLAGMARFAGMMLRLAAMRLSGRYRKTPFFDGEGRPVVVPTVASREDVERARQVVARRAM
jgi:hypothetical protein